MQEKNDYSTESSILYACFRLEQVIRQSMKVDCPNGQSATLTKLLSDALSKGIFDSKYKNSAFLLWEMVGLRKDIAHERKLKSNAEAIVLAVRNEFPELFSCQFFNNEEDTKLILETSRLLMDQIELKFGDEFDSVSAAYAAGVIPKKFSEKVKKFVTVRNCYLHKSFRLGDQQRKRLVELHKQIKKGIFNE